jgi:hypothetical protein
LNKKDNFFWMKTIGLLIKIRLPIVFILIVLILSSCEKNIDIAVKPNQPQLVVEAYINNLFPQYNYVILSHSQDYYAPNFQGTPVANAVVTITEGTKDAAGNYSWNMASKLRLRETPVDSIPPEFSVGLYFDQRAYIDRPHALKGTIGKSYLLEISSEGREYSAIASLIPPVAVDSVTQGFPFVNNVGDTLYRITNHYKDPDTLGNTQLYFWRWSETRKNYGWGGFFKSRVPGTDDLSNGEYVHLTHPQGFSRNDTINYYMASITRDVYNFWDSYNKAQDNNGPFSTPVTLATNITGNNVTGCFSGYALSTKSIVIR